MARVEGETSLAIELDGMPFLQLKIFEPPRFFEGFLVGRKYDEVGDIVSRICGICPISHMTTAILAIEKAAGIQVSEQTTILRRLFSVSQIVASHLVHLYMLAMPDYYGYPGITGMQERFGERIARLHSDEGRREPAQRRDRRPGAPSRHAAARRLHLHSRIPKSSARSWSN